MGVGALVGSEVAITLIGRRRMATALAVTPVLLGVLGLPWTSVFAAALPQPELGQLVSALQPVDTVRSGVDVVTQGEPGDRYFVIVSGSARVLRDGVTPREDRLGVNEGFFPRCERFRGSAEGLEPAQI